MKKRELEIKIIRIKEDLLYNCNDEKFKEKIELHFKTFKNFIKDIDLIKNNNNIEEFILLVKDEMVDYKIILNNKEFTATYINISYRINEEIKIIKDLNKIKSKEDIFKVLDEELKEEEERILKLYD